MTEKKKDKKDIEKEETPKFHVEELMPDGSVRRSPGKEPLLKERWDMLKAALNNEESIVRLVPDEDFDPEVQAQEEAQAEAEQQAAQDQVMAAGQQGDPQQAQAEEAAPQDQQVDPGHRQQQEEWLRNEGVPEDQIQYILGSEQPMAQAPEQAAQAQMADQPQNLALTEDGAPASHQVAAAEIGSDKPNLDRIKAAMMLEEHKLRLQHMKEKHEHSLKPKVQEG